MSSDREFFESFLVFLDQFSDSYVLTEASEDLWKFCELGNELTVHIYSGTKSGKLGGSKEHPTIEWVNTNYGLHHSRLFPMGVYDLRRDLRGTLKMEEQFKPGDFKRLRQCGELLLEALQERCPPRHYLDPRTLKSVLTPNRVCTLL